jgi:anti-anti-sigma regulatory factor
VIIGGMQDTCSGPSGIEHMVVSARTSVTSLTGEHDLASQQRVVDALLLATARQNVIVDLTFCTFIDTTILDVLYAARRLQASHDRLELVVPGHNGFVDRWSRLTGVRLAIATHGTLAEALESVGEPPATSAA